MAYKLNYECEHGVFDQAYMIIDKISIVKIDEEILKPTDDGHMKLTYRPKLVYEATIRIYSDQGARENRAMPIKTTSITFDGEGRSDLFQAAYEEILESNEFSQFDLEDC